MPMAAQGDWSPEQQRRLGEFAATRCVDVHCHCLAGLDDGPASLEESIALCQALVEDGITTVVATPHQLGRYDRLNSSEVIRQAVEALQLQLRERKIPLEIYPGGDVRVDERIAKLLDSGEVATTADAGRHLLLELPHELFVNPISTIDLLRDRGLQAIMTHPERHRYLPVGGDWAREWIRHGAVLQVTAGSLLGEFGSRAQASAWRLVMDGVVSIVASDAHDARRRPPRMSEAINELQARTDAGVARTLAIDNPLKVLGGEEIALPTLP